MNGTHRNDLKHEICRRYSDATMGTFGKEKNANLQYISIDGKNAESVCPINHRKTRISTIGGATSKISRSLIYNHKTIVDLHYALFFIFSTTIDGFA